MEVYKLVDSILYPQDPSQFIPHVLDPSVTVSWNCNDMTTLVRGIVVNVRPVVTADTPIKQLVGQPLINIEIPHEFPQPHDLILKENHTVHSQNNMLFFSSATFLTIGPIPVTFCKYITL